MQAIMGQMGRAGAQFFNTMNRNMSNRNRNRQQPGQTEENERPPVRIRLEVGFAAPQAPPSAVATALTARLTRLAEDHSIGQPQISVEGDTVVLRGTAESESQRRVLERFVMLEPGVMSVRNEMVVAAAPTVEELPTAEPLPATGN
jgi:osmotically-inducible protein OsmY